MYKAESIFKKVKVVGSEVEPEEDGIPSLLFIGKNLEVSESGAGAVTQAPPPPPPCSALADVSAVVLRSSTVVGTPP